LILEPLGAVNTQILPFTDLGSKNRFQGFWQNPQAEAGLDVRGDDL
jgi:hypothetical protein